MWIFLLLAVASELVSFVRSDSDMTKPEDWQALSIYLKEQTRAGDVFESYPRWTSPLLRHHASFLKASDISFARKTEDHLYGKKRLWMVAIRNGAFPPPPGAVSVSKKIFGKVRVELFNLPAQPLYYSALDHVQSFRVWTTEKQVQQDETTQHECEWKTHPHQQSAGGGEAGLGQGPIFPKERWVCSAKDPWLFVGKTSTVDLNYVPRNCIWQHPPGSVGKSIISEMQHVRLGAMLRLEGGLYAEAERDEKHSPIDVRMKVMLSGQTKEVAWSHRDGEGWKDIAWTLPKGWHGKEATVQIDVRSAEVDRRWFCWNLRSHD